MKWIIPTWVYWIAIGVLLLAVGGQQVRVANLQSDLDKEVLAREVERGQRLQLALDHSIEIGRLKDEHAIAQSKKDETYGKEILVLKRSNALYVADAGRLRNKLATYTSGAAAPGETPAAAGERALYRLPIVGGLLAEGVDLEAESRGIIQQRDLEVGRLLDQIKIDRAACSPAS